MGSRVGGRVAYEGRVGESPFFGSSWRCTSLELVLEPWSHGDAGGQVVWGCGGDRGLTGVEMSSERERCLSKRPKKCLSDGKSMTFSSKVLLPSKKLITTFNYE